MIDIREGDCLTVMAEMIQEGIRFDGAVTDPPYHLGSIVKRLGGDNAKEIQVGATGAFNRAAKGFMNQKWDSGDVAFQVETWRLVHDLLKPGAILAAFSGTRGYHRMATAIEDAGFIVLDMIQWQYGSGFPKNYNVAKAIDKALGAVGPHPEPWRPISPEAKASFHLGTALKPAQEPICIAIRPREGSILTNLALHGTGCFNIDRCRVEHDEVLQGGAGKLWSHYREGSGGTFHTVQPGLEGGHPAGRWPSNVIHDGSEEATMLYPDEAGQRAVVKGSEPSMPTNGIFGPFAARLPSMRELDRGSAARFNYSGKTRPGDRVTRCESCGTRYMGKRKTCCRRELHTHPTVKPVDIMRWILGLVIPPGGRVLDPFAGTGTTGIAALAEGMRSTLIEADPLHVGDIRFRLDRVRGLDTDLLRDAR